MKAVIQKLSKGDTLTYEEAKDCLVAIGKGEVNPATIAAFLTVFMMRAITGEELLGFRKAMLELALKIDFKGLETMDMCGTGGDGKNTFNISTCSSFVVAASGVKVSKHGNYGVSSGVGSSNVIEHLGYQFTNDAAQLQKEIEETNITFLHAPLFHPAMKNVAPIRKELGLKTFFNMLGPLSNPCQPAYQLSGVYAPEILPLFDYVLSKNTTRFAVIHADDVYDEISLTCDFKVVSNKEKHHYSPTDFGFSKINPSEISGGDSIEESADILVNVLKGVATEPQKNVVASNAGLGIHVAKNVSLQEGIKEATSIINEGKGFEVLSNLLKLNSEIK